MRQGWPQVICFWLVLLVTALFLGWTADRLVAHLALLPTFVAVLPGALLTAATGGAARFAAYPAKRSVRSGGAGFLLSAVPLAAASASVAAWLALWLVLTSGTPTWAAITFALALALGIAVALLAFAQPGAAASAGPVSQVAAASVPSRLPRRLVARRRRARKRLDDHTRLWMTAAHQYAVTLSGTSRAGQILANLLAGNAGRLPFDDLDPLDAMILSALRNYHPAALAAGLNAAPPG